MQVERNRSALQTVGLMAMLMVGILLGGAGSVLAGSEVATISIACTEGAIVGAETSEWAVPPAPGRPGEPY